jgi:chromosome segregation ATPase
MLDPILSLAERPFDQLTPAQVMALASSTRTAHNARKQVTLHKMRRLESELNTAKGKVRECEEGMTDLQKELEEADENLGLIDSSVADFEHLMQQAEQQSIRPIGSSIGTAHSVDSRLGDR